MLLKSLQELLTVWNALREGKTWRESDEAIGRVVVRRLRSMAKVKGFGNARAVRQKLDEACTRAMAREDFDPTNLELQLEDAVGVNPIHNTKLQTVLKEFDQMTGWNAVKEQVNNLVKICGQNYDRELNGQEPLPIFLNRLFLGNPGTGEFHHSIELFIKMTGWVLTVPLLLLRENNLRKDVW